MERKNIFTGAKALVAAVLAFVVFNIFVASCSEFDKDGEMPTLTNTIVEPGDSIHDTTTVYIDKEWTLVRLDTINTVDSLLITVTMEANDGERRVLHGFSTTYPEKSGYEIFAEEEILYPDFSNKGVRGGGMTKENVTDSGYVAVYVWSFPTNDGNVVYDLIKMEVLKKMPVVRPIRSKILSLDGPMQTRAAEKYKVKDAPISAVSQIDFETEGFKEEKSFSTVLKTGFDRDLMAYDDLKEVLLNDSSRVPVDDKTDRAEVELKLVNKSGSSSLRSYNILCNRSVTTIPAQIFDVKEFVENYSSTKDFAVIDSEKEVYADSLWRKLGQTKLWSSKWVGGATINTDYRVYLERPIFSKFGITVDFGYGSFDIKEGNSDVEQVTSDRAEHDKAIFTNRINTTYMGSFKQTFSEYANLYKKVEFQDEIVDAYFDDAKKEKKYTPTTETFKAVFVEKWKSGKVDETPFEWTRNRGLEEGPAYTRICKDTYNYTSTPDINVKSSKVTKKGDKGEEWSGNEDKGTISSSVEFNGAEKADVLFYSTETNDVKLTYKGKVQEFGHDTYSFTLRPALGSGSVKDGYTVYPYTATLNYTFGDAAAKQATDKGSIKVAVPKEPTFFPEEWGTLEKVEQTTTHTKNKQSWMHVFSLKFYNKETGKRYVYFAVLSQENPTTPMWGGSETPDFSTVEEVDKNLYDAYNSAYWFNTLGTWRNAVAEDARQWLQWSRYDTGNKKGHGSELYDTAKSKNWDSKSMIDGRATVFSKRYDLKVVDGKFSAVDTYTGKKVTDKYAKDGGWK